jgi:hypothetical protein
MLHPLLKLVATRPDLLTDHAQAYAELLGDEFGRSMTHWRDRALYTSLAGGFGLLGLTFLGVAVMLWSVTPPEQIVAPWALIATPALPIVVAIGCWLRSRSRPLDKPFEVVKQQVHADLSMLREVSAS